MLYVFELGYKSAEATRNIFCGESEGTVDHSKVTRLFKNFLSGCKNHDNHVKPGRSKTVISTLRVSGKLGISQSSVIHHLHNLSKSIKICQIMSLVNKI